MSVVQEQQQLHVDTEPLGALPFDEVRDLGAGDEVDVDVFAFRSAAFADLAKQFTIVREDGKAAP